MNDLLQAEDISPCGYNVLVEMDEVNDTSEGGVYLGERETAREQAAVPSGTVLAFGPACFKNHDSGVNSPKDWGVKVGDKIHFPRHAYQRVEGGKSTLVYILDHDVKAVIKVRK